MTSIADRYDYSCKRHTAPMGCQKWKVFQSYNHFLPAISSLIIKWTHTTKSTFDLLEFYKLSLIGSRYTQILWHLENCARYSLYFLLKNQSLAKEESASCIFLHNCNFLKYLKSTLWKSLKNQILRFFSSIIWKLQNLWIQK